MTIKYLSNFNEIAPRDQWPEHERGRWEVLRGTFSRRLAAINSTDARPNWQYVAYDQLNENLGLLGQSDPAELGIILIESTWKPSLRPYHKQKLVLLLSSQRHFALEQAKRGVAVRYIFTDHTPAHALVEAFKSTGPIAVMRPAERELREHLQPLVEARQLVELPHDGWLTAQDDFVAAMKGKKTWRMDAFYRHIRKRYGVLLTDDKKPVGGKWSFDGDNRRPWNGDPIAPTPPHFEVDEVTAEVAALVAARYHAHPGDISADRIPARIEDVRAYWSWVKHHCLENFGPYEDAMHHEARQLFHTRMSGLLNLHRITPREVLEDVEAAPVRLNSKEGLIRQLLGWREYVHHVHEATDGFRHLPEHAKAQPGPQCDGPNLLQSKAPLPPVYWGTESGLFCLDHAVKEVVEDAHSHHINRLMILANWGSLLDISPRELTDWFWVMFEDAYDWVVEPNVFGMGTYALGELMMTKPYVSGSAYVNKMSSYCGECAFSPQQDCPMTSLYWNYLGTHSAQFAGNPRMSLVMASHRRRTPEKVADDQLVFEAVSTALRDGVTLTPTRLKELLEENECRRPNSFG